MRLTETINTIEQLESISFDGIVYLVRVKTNKPGNHYISGFHSEEQAKKYRASLEVLEDDKSFVQVTTTEEVIHHLTVSCTITSITPVNEYIIQKTDAIYSMNPELTSSDLLAIVNDALTPKQVTDGTMIHTYNCRLITPNTIEGESNPIWRYDYDVLYVTADSKTEARKKAKTHYGKQKFTVSYYKGEWHELGLMVPLATPAW